MKKLLGVSIAAMLAVTPMIASANGTTPTAATSVATDNAPFVGVTEDSTANIATTSYVQGAYNAAIGAVNTRLKTAADGNANIDQTVKTSIAPANSASDTALVTEKAIRNALDLVASGAEIDGGAGIDVTSNKVSVDLTSNGGLKMNEAGDSGTLEISKGKGLTIDTTGEDAGKLRVAVTDSKGLGFNSNGTLEVVDGDGIKTGANGVEVDLVSTNATLKITDHQLEAKVGDGLQAGLTGIEAKLTDKGGLAINSFTKDIEVVVDEGTIVKDSSTGALGVKANVFDAYNAASDAQDAIEAKLTAGTDGYAINAQSVKVQGSDVSTETGVTATISNSTVPVYTTWGSSDAANVNVQSSYYRTDARTNGVNAAPANPS